MSFTVSLNFFAIMHQSVPSTNIPPGDPQGLHSTAAPGPDLYLMSLPGGRVFAYP